MIRRSNRSEQSLRWEFDLLGHLSEHDCHVPEILLSDDGHRHVNGWHVLKFVHGRSSTQEDVAVVCKELIRVHQCTTGWPQRPDAASANTLLSEHTGNNDVDLKAMPDALANVIRQSWLAVQPKDQCVIHGDPGGANALITSDGNCVLIDWDEARVDDPLFDLQLTDAEQRAALAWEIAVCWTSEPAYARALADELLVDEERCVR